MADFIRSKTAILTILAALKFDFILLSDNLKCEFPKKSKFKAQKNVKMAIFDLLKSAKIDFT